MEAQRKLELQSAAIAENLELTKKAEKQTLINQLALNSVRPRSTNRVRSKTRITQRRNTPYGTKNGGS